MPIAVAPMISVQMTPFTQEGIFARMAERLRAREMTVTLLPGPDMPVMQVRFAGGVFHVAAGCTGAARCLTFYASFRPSARMSAEQVRTWAQGRPMLSAEIDKAGHPAIEMILGSEQASDAELDAALGQWIDAFTAFRDFTFARRGG